MGLSINRLLVSEALFGLAAAAVRHRSVKVGRFVSISEVLEAASLAAPKLNLGKAEIDEWLAIDQHGPIPVTLVTRERWRADYERARQHLSDAAGHVLTARQMLVILTHAAIRAADRD